MIWMETSFELHVPGIKNLPLSFQHNEFHHIHLQVLQRQSLHHNQSEFQIAQLASTRDWIKTCQWTATIYCINSSQYWPSPSINPSKKETFLYFPNLFFFLSDSKMKISIHITLPKGGWTSKKNSLLMYQLPIFPKCVSSQLKSSEYI